MVGKTWGRPRKKARNITGLRNQDQHATSPPISKGSIRLSGKRELDECQQNEGKTISNGLKISFEQEYDGSAPTDESEVDEEIELELLEDEEFGWKLADMVEKENDRDLDWIPERLKRDSKRQKNAMKRQSE